MKKNTILKKIEFYEDKITNVIHELQDFLDSTEDPELSSMGNDLCDSLLDFIHENDICSLNDIRNFIEEEFER